MQSRNPLYWLTKETNKCWTLGHRVNKVIFFSDSEHVLLNFLFIKESWENAVNTTGFNIYNNRKMVCFKINYSLFKKIK